MISLSRCGSNALFHYHFNHHYFPTLSQQLTQLSLLHGVIHFKWFVELPVLVIDLPHSLVAGENHQLSGRGRNVNAEVDESQVI